MNRKQLLKTPISVSFLQKINFLPDKRFTVFGFFMIIAAAGLLTFNAFYGLGVPDESFYLTIPYRILKGDTFFINEWHVAQLSAALQYPLVWLFLKATGSGEGLILFFRLLFVLCQALASGFIFLRMKRYGFASALFSALLFELYVPEYTMSLDYYTLSLFPILVIAFLLFFNDNPSPLSCIVCGVLLSIAVLAEPPIALIYVVFLLSVLTQRIKKKPHPFLNFRLFGFVSAGVAIAATAFLVFFFSRETISDFLPAVKNIFRSGEYSRNTLFIGYPMMIKSLIDYFSWAAGALLLFPLVLIIDRKRQSRKLMWALLCVIIAAACVIIVIWKSISSRNPLPFIHLPCVIAFIGINAFILLKKRKKELLYLWLTGFFYFILIALTSEATNYIGAYGFMISCIASVPLMTDLFNELSEETKEKTAKKQRVNTEKKQMIVKVLTTVSITLSIIVFFIFFQRVISRDPVIPEFCREPLNETVVVDRGGFKGIRLSPQQKAVNDSMLNDISYIESQTDGKYTVLSQNSWYLFSSDRAPLAFTMWYLRDTDCYIDYYRYLNEMPTYIYIINRSMYWGKAGEFMDIETELSFFTSVFDCTIIEGEAGVILKVNGSHVS